METAGRGQKGKVCLHVVRGTGPRRAHCGLRTSLLAGWRHTGQCSEKSSQDDKQAGRLIYEDSHNKICILGSTKTSQETWSLSTSLWRLWILRRIAGFHLIFEMVTENQWLADSTCGSENMKPANPSLSHWQKAPSKDSILQPSYLDFCACSYVGPLVFCLCSVILMCVSYLYIPSLKMSRMKYFIFLKKTSTSKAGRWKHLSSEQTLKKKKVSLPA